MASSLKRAVTGTKPATVQQLLTDPRVKSQIALALPQHITPERLMRVALTEVRRTPALAKCKPESLLAAIMQCAQLGLEPGGGLGHAWLIPFKEEAQFIIGYRGMIDLARRSGQILSIEARAVYEADTFHVSFGLEPDLTHEPAWDAADRGPLRFVYAVAKLKDGGFQFEVMSRAEIEKVRAQSKAGNNGPWVTHFEEMAKKTVIRRLFKYLPVSVELARAVTLDEAAERGEQGSVIDADCVVEPDTEVETGNGGESTA